MDNLAFQMNGVSYFSSYEMLPVFMGASKKLPPKAVKIAEINHNFVEILLQGDLVVNTAVYMANVWYCNIFAIYLKTNFRDVESIIGKLHRTYDCVLIVHAFDKNNAVKKFMPEILHVSLVTLIYEMGLADMFFEVIPSKTALGKKINMVRTKESLEILIYVTGREELSKLISLE